MRNGNLLSMQNIFILVLFNLFDTINVLYVRYDLYDLFLQFISLNIPTTFILTLFSITVNVES